MTPMIKMWQNLLFLQFLLKLLRTTVIINNNINLSDRPVGRAEGLKFKSRAGQIGRSVANGCSRPLRHFFERSCVDHRRGDGLRKLFTRLGAIQRV